MVYKLYYFLKIYKNRKSNLDIDYYFTIVRIFGKKGSIEILSILLDKGKLYQDELGNFVGMKGGQLVDRVKELREYGLIDWEVEDKFGGKKWIFLTPEGKEIAKHLIEIEKIMGRIEKKRGG